MEVTEEHIWNNSGITKIQEKRVLQEQTQIAHTNCSSLTYLCDPSEEIYNSQWDTLKKVEKIKKGGATFVVNFKKKNKRVSKRKKKSYKDAHIF